MTKRVWRFAEYDIDGYAEMTAYMISKGFVEIGQTKYVEVEYAKADPTLFVVLKATDWWRQLVEPIPGAPKHVIYAAIDKVLFWQTDSPGRLPLRANDPTTRQPLMKQDSATNAVDVWHAPVAGLPAEQTPICVYDGTMVSQPNKTVLWVWADQMQDSKP